MSRFSSCVLKDCRLSPHVPETVSSWTTEIHVSWGHKGNCHLNSRDGWTQKVCFLGQGAPVGTFKCNVHPSWWKLGWHPGCPPSSHTAAWGPALQGCTSLWADAPGDPRTDSGALLSVWLPSRHSPSCQPWESFSSDLSPTRKGCACSLCYWKRVEK